MPEDSPGVKVSAVRDTYGAEVRFCQPTQEAREAMSAELVQALRAQFGEDQAEEIHPNQDVRVVNGQGSVGLELLEQEPNLDAIVVSTDAEFHSSSSSFPKQCVHTEGFLRQV